VILYIYFDLVEKLALLITPSQQYMPKQSY